MSRCRRTLLPVASQVARCGQLCVHGLTGQQQVHDLAGAFEDPVDADVTEHLLDRDGALATGGQRVGGFVAAASSDLEQFVDDLVPDLAGPEFGERGFDADVVASLVGHVPGQVQHRLERERCRRDEGGSLPIVGSAPREAARSGETGRNPRRGAMTLVD